MDIIEKLLLSLLNFALFVALSIVFLPSFLIVTYLQKPWADLMKKTLNF